MWGTPVIGPLDRLAYGNHCIGWGEEVVLDAYLDCARSIASAACRERRARFARWKKQSKFAALNNLERAHHAIHHMSLHMAMQMPFANRSTWEGTHEASLILLDGETERIGWTEGSGILKLRNCPYLWAVLDRVRICSIGAGNRPAVSVYVEGMEVAHHSHDAEAHLSGWACNQGRSIPQEFAPVDTHSCVAQCMKQQQILCFAWWCAISRETKAEECL